MGARIKVGTARRGMVPLVRAGRRGCEFVPQRAGRRNAARVREVREVRVRGMGGVGGAGRAAAAAARRAAGASPPFTCAT